MIAPQDQPSHRRRLRVWHKWHRPALVCPWQRIGNTARVSSPPIQPLPPTMTHPALGYLALRLLTLVLAFASAWLLVDYGLGAWVEHQDLILGQVAQYVPQADPSEIPTLLAIGEPDAVLPVVLACDIAQPSCRRQFAQLVQWHAQKSPILTEELTQSRGARRVIFLRRAQTEASQRIGLTWQALWAQGLVWGNLQKWAEDPSVWTPEQPGRMLRDVEVDADRRARVENDPETVLAVQLERTMAEGLEIPEGGLLVAGLPVPATQAEGHALEQTLEAAEKKLAENIRFFHGDVDRAQARLLAELPVRARDRYWRWILVGKKVLSLPQLSGVDANPPAEEPEDPDDDDEPEGDEGDPAR